MSIIIGCDGMCSSQEKIQDDMRRSGYNGWANHVDSLEGRLVEAEAREQALAAHMERLHSLLKEHHDDFENDTLTDWDEMDWSGRVGFALEDTPVTSLARRDAEKQAEGMESLVPRVADGIGRSLSLSEDDIITLEEWIGDLAETHREAKGATS